jgi:hypothetical protein
MSPKWFGNFFKDKSPYKFSKYKNRWGEKEGLVVSWGELKRTESLNITTRTSYIQLEGAIRPKTPPDPLGRAGFLNIHEVGWSLFVAAL